MSALVEARNMYKFFGEIHAVNGVTLLVNAGEIYGLMGPDGAGKTTAIRLLCGALQPEKRVEDSTVVKIAGFDMRRQTEHARSMIGYLPQRFSLYEELTVIENLRFLAEVRGLKDREWRPRCMEILEFVGLAEYQDRRAGHLSGGMRQKLGLAAAIVHRPRVLLLDEPTTGVDPVTRQDFWQLLIQLVGGNTIQGNANSSTMTKPRKPGEHQEHSELNTAVLISTPYMDEAARCSRVGFLREGRLVVEGTPADLRKQFQAQVLELTGRPLPLLRRLSAAQPGVLDVQMFGDRLHLCVEQSDVEQIINQLHDRIPAEGGQIERLRPVSPQLEDVFIDLLKAASI